jgi:hypothetical protein
LRPVRFIFSLTIHQAYYPINNTLVGTGNETDITFNSNSQTNFTFPFSLEFSTNMSSSTQILTDLATKCGVGGGAVQDITVDLDITVRARTKCYLWNSHLRFPCSAWFTRLIFRGLSGVEHSRQLRVPDICFRHFGMINFFSCESCLTMSLELDSIHYFLTTLILMDENVAAHPAFVSLLEHRHARSYADSAANLYKGQSLSYYFTLDRFPSLAMRVQFLTLLAEDSYTYVTMIFLPSGHPQRHYCSAGSKGCHSRNRDLVLWLPMCLSARHCLL